MKPELDAVQIKLQIANFPGNTMGIVAQLTLSATANIVLLPLLGDHFYLRRKQLGCEPRDEFPESSAAECSIAWNVEHIKTNCRVPLNEKEQFF